jgi:hypothetical protein
MHESSERDPNQFSPVFVLATPRSYSSIVTTMIGQHPQLMGLPELKLFAYPTVGELHASLPRFWIERGVKHRSPGLVRAVAQCRFGRQDCTTLALALSWLEERSHWTGTEMLDSLQHVIAPRSIVEKSPENVESDDALARLVSAYPRARFLHLTRHPVATQRSMQKHLQRTLSSYSADTQPTRYFTAWIDVHTRILALAEALPPSRYLRIKAEDVLNQPATHLRSIAGWLGICTDSEAIGSMTRPQDSVFASEGPANSGIVGGNDPDFLRNPSPRPVETPSALEHPAGWGANPTLWEATVSLANRLGYV